jgi:cytidine deaminase
MFYPKWDKFAEMLKHKESEIAMIVAVNTEKKVGPPCGRCRELIYQVNPRNIGTQIVLGEEKVVSLKELLPYNWQEVWDQA